MTKKNWGHQIKMKDNRQLTITDMKIWNNKIENEEIAEFNSYVMVNVVYCKHFLWGQKKNVHEHKAHLDRSLSKYHIYKQMICIVHKDRQTTGV